ncbi:MAG: glycosyltransferase family 2 protein [Deltaproteobacteria bacterium]|nr:glycosyltransferase family 2 protein [Deltaproteobacteria bacterium]
MEAVSVAVITRNEGRNIRECLASVQWASEIVVVDRFSSDDTVEIAREMGATVYQEEWHGYAQQKNLAMEKTRGAWILNLDADERIPPPLRGEILETLPKAGDTVGYYIARRNYFCGKWIRYGGWYPDYTLRLLRKGAGRFEERAVHEKLRVHGRTGRLEHPMEHYSYRSISDYLERLDRYSALAALELKKGMVTASWAALSLRPLFTFFKMYIMRRGFLDGREGFFLAVSYAYYTFLKYYRTTEAASGLSFD